MLCTGTRATRQRKIKTAEKLALGSVSLAWRVQAQAGVNRAWGASLWVDWGLLQELKGNIRVFCRVRPLSQDNPTTEALDGTPLVQLATAGTEPVLGTAATRGEPLSLGSECLRFLYCQCPR